MVRALASHQCGSGLIPELCLMWVEFVVGSCPYSERFFSLGTPVSSLLLKTNISKFQFNLAYCQALQSALAWEILQALSMLLTLNKLLYFT